jgi:hypothetical protein
MPYGFTYRVSVVIWLSTVCVAMSNDICCDAYITPYFAMNEEQVYVILFMLYLLCTRVMMEH